MFGFPANTWKRASASREMFGRMQEEGKNGVKMHAKCMMTDISMERSRKLFQLELSRYYTALNIKVTVTSTMSRPCN